MRRRQILTAAGGGALATVAGGLAYIEFVVDSEPVTGFYYTESREVDGQCVVPYFVKRADESDRLVVLVDGEERHVWEPRGPLERLIFAPESASLTVEAGSTITLTAESDGVVREIASIKVTESCEAVEQEVDS